MNKTNAITQRSVKDGSSTSAFTPVYDKAGNLILDQDYLYEYDAWSRLVKVSESGDLAPGANPGAFTGTVGPWITHYTYDGLGRLIRKQSPWPTLDPYGRSQVRTEHYYYDGVRRVQEVFTDPLPVDDNAPSSIANELSGPPPLQTVIATTREYIHSPGYVDEYVAEIDIAAGGEGTYDRPAWVIQDANYNVVALIADDGQMLHQYTWDAYGQPIAIDRYDTGSGAAAPFANRIGHQGLFFDRFDGGSTNVLEDQLGVNGTTGIAFNGLYQNGNRSYSPHLGRFVQRDPNGTAQLQRSAGVQIGARPRASIAIPSLARTYGDGSSLYGYLGSMPVCRTDPDGLFFGGLAGLLMAGLDGAESAADSLESARQGLGTFAALHAVLEQYAGQQDLDADWASDWSQRDDGLVPGMSEDQMEDHPSDLLMAGRKGKASGGGVKRLPPKSLRNKKKPVIVNGKRMVVTFDRNGYPIFPRGAVKDDISYPQSGNREADAKGANAKCGYDRNPPGYEWHHHQNKNRMQLVHEDAHAVWHYGGIARHR